MNNFDKSSSGVSLELDCSYNLELSRHYFEDEIKKCDYSNYYLFSDFDYDLYDLKNYKFTKKDLINLCGECSIDNDDSKHVLGKNLLSCNKLELIEIIEYCHGDGLINFWIENLTPKFEIITSCGYCQGDQVDVVIPQDLEFEASQKYIDHLFWDSPIYCQLEIDNQEFDFLEFINDFYEWDVLEVLAIAEKHINHSKKEYILKWLIENIPTELEYR